MRLGIAETDLSGERACKFCPLHHGKTLLCVLVMCFLFKKFIVLFLPSYFQVHLFGFIKFIVSLVNFLLSCLPWPLPFYTFPCIWICFIQFVPPKFCSYLYLLAFACSFIVLYPGLCLLLFYYRILLYLFLPFCPGLCLICHSPVCPGFCLSFIFCPGLCLFMFSLAPAFAYFF